MPYTVKEIFYTLQGEGAHAGRAAVFCRFAGCNLWTGREEDRASAVCRFCDTDFVGVAVDGGRFSTAGDLADAVARAWRSDDDGGRTRYVVCTGGEPLLQLDEAAIETNGTQSLPRGLDWVCVSPKAGAPLVVQGGDELKLVYPQEGAEPGRFRHLEFQRFSLQPMDGPQRDENTRAAIAYCIHHPQWRLSVQTHKALGIR